MKPLGMCNFDLGCETFPRFNLMAFLAYRGQLDFFKRIIYHVLLKEMVLLSGRARCNAGRRSWLRHHTSHQSSSRSLQSSMGSGNNHNIFTVTPAVIRHSSCPVSPVSFLVIFTFFFLRLIMHSGHVLTVLRHVSVLPASPTLRSFLSFSLCYSTFTFSFQWVESKGCNFPLPLPFIPKGGHFPLPLPFMIFLLPLLPFQCGPMQVLQCPQLIICSDHISHSVKTAHRSHVQPQVLLQWASRSVQQRCRQNAIWQCCSCLLLKPGLQCFPFSIVLSEEFRAKPKL